MEDVLNPHHVPFLSERQVGFLALTMLKGKAIVAEFCAMNSKCRSHHLGSITVYHCRQHPAIGALGRVSEIKAGEHEDNSATPFARRIIKRKNISRRDIQI